MYCLDPCFTWNLPCTCRFWRQDIVTICITLHAPSACHIMHVGLPCTICMQNHACGEGFLGMAGNMVPILPPWFSLPPPVQCTYTLKISMCNMHVEPHPKAPHFIPPFHVELHSVVDREWFLDFCSDPDPNLTFQLVLWILLHKFFLMFLVQIFPLCSRLVSVL